MRIEIYSSRKRSPSRLSFLVQETMKLICAVQQAVTKAFTNIVRKGYLILIKRGSESHSTYSKKQLAIKSAGMTSLFFVPTHHSKHFQLISLIFIDSRLASIRKQLHT